MNTEKILATEASTAKNAGTENCLAIGTRLNDFEITGILGEGGFGIVYLAFDHSLQRTVAIKEYMPGALAGRSADTSVTVRSERHKATFEAGLKSFINEARLLAQFDHPSLVKVYRFWEENKTAYMVMRHYDGHTLKQIVNKRPKLVTEAWLRFIFKQILEALDTLYRSKILHRDISPDNIIVQKNGVAVLLDFGSARQIIGDMTQGMTVILKPGYAPIEQYADDVEMPQGSWTDIYALAAVMYFAIMKSPPPISVGRVVKDTMLPLQDGEHAGFSAKFLKGIDLALAIQPQDRPQSMEEFRQLLGISSFASVRKSRKGREEHTAGIQADGPDILSTVPGKDANPVKTHRPEPKAKHDQDAGLVAKLRARPLPFVIAGAALVLLAGYFATRPGTNKSDDAALALAQQSLPAPATAAVAVPVVKAEAATASNATAVAASAAEASGKSDPEQLAWDRLKEDNTVTPEALNAFLQQYPQGKFVDAAQARLKEVKAAKAAATKLNLKLSIKPWGTVFVDGVQQGASPPLKNISLTAGKHKIRVTNPGFPDFITEIDAGKSNAATIEHEFTNK
ncbi:serine/threonine protein kinase [Undibacterium umbellatum]|uniref:Serine/threonine protein kinase n=1 Tax=Undibacterium umbellatum TaxID=2762300 RepID=A0ABR6Z9T8_9BURK|nr:serine/threonine-protein kinase [Undibacterium umbellatum]MBC3908336.1 serine/threonine protein kinase [Undibacterium umbellatum]